MLKKIIEANPIHSLGSKKLSGFRFNAKLYSIFFYKIIGILVHAINKDKSGQQSILIIRRNFINQNIIHEFEYHDVRIELLDIGKTQ